MTWREAPETPHQKLQLPHGGMVAYRDLPGPPGAETVLLLHGIGMTADLNWGGSYDTLRRRFRVVAPDLRGHGRSQWPSSSFHLEDCADDVAALTEVLGIERFVAVGYSMGGLIAQLLWRRHPQRTSRLVLCASSRNFLGSPLERAGALFAPAVTAAARINPFFAALGAGMWGRSVLRELHGDLRRFALSEMNHTNMHTVTAAMMAVSEFTSHDWISDIDVPVTVMVMTRDTVVSPARQRKLVCAIPHAKSVMVEGGHTVCLSDPERFSEQLLDACL